MITRCIKTCCFMLLSPISQTLKKIWKSLPILILSRLFPSRGYWTSVPARVFYRTRKKIPRRHSGFAVYGASYFEAKRRMGILCYNVPKKSELFDRMMTSSVEVILFPLVHEFIASVLQKQCNIHAFGNNKKQVLNFSSALYATDVMFSHTSRTYGHQMETKL